MAGDRRGATRGAQAVVATLIGLCFGGLALWLRLSGRSNFSDFDQIWIAARAILHGLDPYAAVPQGFPSPWYYPLPAALIGVPFAALPIEWAGPAFAAIGFALLAYGLLGRGAWAVVGLASYPALIAAQQCQWTPLLAAAALLPWLGWLSVAKPTTGVVTTGAYLSRRWLARNLVIAALLIAASFAIQPSWLREWLAAVSRATHFRPLMLHPLGAPLLLAVLRWRDPRARLLLLIAAVPQTAATYDALLLVLVPSNRREAGAFAFLSLATVPFLIPTDGTGEHFAQALAHNHTVELLALYLPALALVLLRGHSLVSPESGSRWSRRRPSSRPSRWSAEQDQWPDSHDAGSALQRPDSRGALDSRSC